MICMLDDAGAGSGVCIGNDFGAQVCWEAARARPDRFPATFNVGVPYVSAAIGLTTNRGLAALNPFFSYQVYLSENATGAAAELDADPRASIRSCAQVASSKVPATFLARNDTFLGPWKEFMRSLGLKEVPFSGIMSRLVEDYMVMSYKKQGFYNSKVF
jgi:soluble epoxide hydrolase/lipid-phosphate phosphatase